MVPVQLVLAPVEGQARVTRLEQVGEQLVALLLGVDEDEHAAAFVPHTWGCGWVGDDK
jgi:hypothetical protein